MSITHTITRSTKVDNGNTVSYAEDVSADYAVTLDVSIAASTTNDANAVSIDKTKLQSWYLVSSQEVTVKTNSTGSPDNTWTLKAGIPFVWTTQAGYFTNPVSVNITTMYITNAGTTAARVRLHAGLNT